MWMMEYSEADEINSIQDHQLNAAPKLRPLMPRPATAAASIVNPLPCLSRIHATDLLALNHHLAMAEQNKIRDLNAQQVVVSSRWNPTPEQLQNLEELYRRGTRTPSAEQIQHITAQLRRYGKIEGKNVFYWFQNHKARERQKRRRQLETLSDDQQPINNQTENSEKREPAGANRTVYEVEQNTNWASPTNSSTLAEKSGEAEAECKADGWVQFNDDAELQRRRNATWQMMNLSCSYSSSLINSSVAAPSTVTSAPIIPISTMEIKTQHFTNIFLEPYNSQASDHSPTQTLQLFPLQSHRKSNDECTHRDKEDEDEEEDEDEDEDEESGAGLNTDHHVAPCQFFEFLPLKN